MKSIKAILSLLLAISLLGALALPTLALEPETEETAAVLTEETKDDTESTEAKTTAKNGLKKGGELKNGLKSGLKNGGNMKNGLKSGLKSGLKNGGTLKNGLKDGLKNGLKNGEKKS